MRNRFKELMSSDTFSHLPNANYLPRWVVLFIDLLLCTVAFWLSVWVGTGVFDYYKISYNDMWPFGFQYLLVLAVQLLSFWAFHTYSGILRYSTFIDVAKVLLANFATGIIVFIFNAITFATSGLHYVSNSVVLIYVPIAFIILFTLRVGIKTIADMLIQMGTGSPKVMIYGTQNAGVAIAKMLRSSGNAPYRPVGFITDASKTQSYDMVGLHVRQLDERLFDWMQLHGIRHVIVSPTKMRSINPAKDLQVFIDHNIRILTTPYFTQVDNTDEIDAQRIGRIDSIRIEDLLERPQIQINTENVCHILHNKIVLVSGAAGSIGSELVRQVQKFKPKATILLETAESPLHDLTLELRDKFPSAMFIPIIGDVRNRERVEQIFRELHPDIVYHAAAYKHVPLMEDHPNEAVLANVLGTKNMADMAVKYDVERFVMISTDKAVNPTNIMGASKRIAEIYVQSLFKNLQKTNPDCTKFITTRFGNVLGSNGSVIPLFREQIKNGGPVTVTDERIVRFFMLIPEACKLVLEAGTKGNGGEIFVFDMGKPVRIADLAKRMIKLSGAKNVQIKFTGLRPGEKLYEEVLNELEGTKPTFHEKIRIAEVREYDFDQVCNDINELIEIAKRYDGMETVRKMKEMVPEFKSNNSVYEVLDGK